MKMQKGNKDMRAPAGWRVMFIKILFAKYKIQIYLFQSFKLWGGGIIP